MTPSEMQKSMAAARLDPNGFCENVLRSPNDDWQSELFEAIADVERSSNGMPTVTNHAGLARFSVSACHGPGKTHFAAKLMHWWGFTGLCRIPCTGPKEKSITTRLWPEFRKLAGGAVEGYLDILDITATKVVWGGNEDSFAVAETASKPENLQGYHHARLLFIVDEASGVNNNMFPVIEGALTTEGALLLMIGNMTRNQGEFYDSHYKASTREHYFTRRVSYLDSARVPRAWAEGMIAKYGINSPVVKVRVLGEAADADPDQLIPLPWIVDAAERDSATDGSIPRRRITVDVADGGEDFTVATAALLYDTKTVGVRQEQHSFAPAESPVRAADAVEELAASMGWGKLDCDVVVDAMGVGAGTAGTLMQRGWSVVRYAGGAESDDSKRWRNRRVQSYIVLRDELRDGLLALAPGFCDDVDELHAQLCSVRRVQGAERVEDLETKKTMRQRGVKSPDRADGLAMVYATQRPTVATAGFVEAEAVVGSALVSVGEEW